MQPKAHLVYVKQEAVQQVGRLPEPAQLAGRVRGPERSRRYPSAIDQPLSKLPQGPTDKGLFNTFQGLFQGQILIAKPTMYALGTEHSHPT